MRFRVTVDGVQREVEVEAADAAAASLLAAVTGAAVEPPGGAGASEASDAEAGGVGGYEVRGGVSDAGVSGGGIAESGAAAAGTRFEVPATLDGRVVQVRVQAGDRVRRSDPLVLIESLKVESWVQAPGDGTVASVRVVVDDTVHAGATVLVLDIVGDG